MKKQKILLTCLLLAVVSSAAFADGWSAWTPKYEGIWYRTYVDNDALSPQRYYAIRIDLENSNIDFMVSQGTGQLDTNDEFLRKTVSDFLIDNELKIAVNANWFNHEGYPTYTNAHGSVVSNGTRYSPYNSNYAAELRIIGNVAGIYQSTGNANVDWAIAGREYIVTDGTNIAPDPGPLDDDFQLYGLPNSRTSVGMTSDERFIIILTIDGGGALDLVGATAVGIADTMIWLGCQEAILLDGGGSTQLCGQWSTDPDKYLNTPDETPIRTVPVGFGADSDALDYQMCAWGYKQSTGQIICRSWRTSLGWTWGTYSPPAAGSSTSPCVISRGPGIIDLFMIGLDENIYQRTYVYGSGWGSWVSIGKGPGNDGVFVLDGCSSGSNRMYLTTISTVDNRCYLRTWTPNGWGSWTAFTDGTFNTLVKPAIVSWGIGRLDIFNRGLDGTMRHKYFNGSTWSSWVIRAGAPASGCGIDAAADKYGRIYVFYLVESGDAYACRARTYTASSGWSSETNLGGVLDFSGPAACSYKENHVAVFVKSATNDDMYYRQNTGSWGGWVNVGDVTGMYSNMDGSSWSNDTGTHFPQ